MPYKVYKYDESDPTILTGFTDEFLANPNAYSNCDTMEIPPKVITIGEAAFLESIEGSAIPLFITKLTFAENSTCHYIDRYAFTFSPLTSVTFPNSLEYISADSFNASKSLNYIAWSLPDDLSSIHFGRKAFYDISPSGQVESLNPLITSQRFLDWIKEQGDFPSGDGWIPVN